MDGKNIDDINIYESKEKLKNEYEEKFQA